VTDLSNASQVAATSFHITKVSAGSVIVDAEILPQPSGRCPDPQAVALYLTAQSQDPNSPLRSGILTRHVTAVTRGNPSTPVPLYAQEQPLVTSSFSTLNPHQVQIQRVGARVHLHGLQNNIKFKKKGKEKRDGDFGCCSTTGRIRTPAEARKLFGSRVIACKRACPTDYKWHAHTCARTHTLYEQDVMSPRGMQEQQLQIQQKQQIQQKPQIQQKHTNVPGYDQLSGPLSVTNKPRASPPLSTSRMDVHPQLSGPHVDWPPTWPKVSAVFCLLLPISRPYALHALGLSLYSLFPVISLAQRHDCVNRCKLTCHKSSSGLHTSPSPIAKPSAN
jgi:hypothetical protein